MPQRHGIQQGLFLVTTNTKHRIPWLTWEGVPEILIDNLTMAKNLYGAEIYAFCILPDHMHLVVRTGEKGLSRFMHSFKRNSSKDIGYFLRERSGNRTRAVQNNNIDLQSRDSVIPAQDGEFTGWHNGFHTRPLVSSEFIHNALMYVGNNAMHHNLVTEPEGWPWSSLHFEHLINHPEC